jgi:hypothetical protein
VGGASSKKRRVPMKHTVLTMLSKPKYDTMSSLDDTRSVPKMNAKPIPNWFAFKATPVAIVLSCSGNHEADKRAGVH